MAQLKLRRGNQPKGILWPINRTNTSVPQSSTTRITDGRFRKREHEHTFGDDCIVRNEIGMDAQRQFIPRHAMPKITRKIFAAQLIDARTNHRS